ncbi:MAG: hypothetical protein ACXWJB_10640 [Limisphaerales bacterium]
MNTLVVPILTPAYDGPGITGFELVVVVALGTVTAWICLRCFQKRHIADWVAASLCALFSCYLLYALCHRIF